MPAIKNIYMFQVQPEPMTKRRRSSRLSYSELKSIKSKETKPKIQQPQSPFPQPPPMNSVSFKDWQHETSQALKSHPSGDNTGYDF